MSLSDEDTGAWEEGYNYLVEVRADGSGIFVDVLQAGILAVLGTCEGHARPSRVNVKPDIRVILHYRYV